jgi:protein TonB
MAAPIRTQTAHAAGGAQRPETTPTPAPAQAAAGVIALTTRDDFLLELGECLEGSASIAPVETAALALAAVAKSKTAQVLVIDSRDFADLRAEVDLLHARAPTLTTLVFAQQDAEVEVAAALKGSNVFAVLPLPVDARKTAAVFGGAVADAEARRSAARAAGAAARPAAVARPEVGAGHGEKVIEAPVPAAAPVEPPRSDDAGSRKVKGLALAGVAFAVVVAAAAWFLTREESPAPADVSPPSAAAEPAPVSESPPVASLPAVAGSVDELLEKARIAMRERRYTTPANNSALLYYRSAVEADPGNAEALDGLNRLRPVIVARFDELSKAGRHDDAAGALAQLESAVPGDPAVAELRLRLASARIAKAIEEGNAGRVTELVRSAQDANEVPAAQLAKWRSEIARLEQEAKQQQLAERQARDAAAAEQKARAARAAQAVQEAQAAQERESARKLEAERAQQAALAAAKAAESKAGAARSASQRVEPKLKRNVTPDFPPEAFDKGISGLVTVAYTVDVEGRTQDVRVESSEPPGVFDKAATSAVRRWRYEPATVDGVPTEAELRISIRFTLPK